MIVERGHVGLIRSGRRTQSRVLVDGREPGYRRRRHGARGQSHQLVTPWRPRVGDRIPIQLRRTDGDGRVRIDTELYVVAVDVRGPLPAGATTRGDAIACGYGTLTAWKAAWVREHGKQWVTRERDRQALRAAAAEVGLDLGEAYVRRLVAEHGCRAAEVFRKVEHEQAVAVLDALHAAGARPDATRRDPEAPPVLPTLTAAQLAARFDAHHAGQHVWVIDHEVAVEDAPLLLEARPGMSEDGYVHSPAAAMSGSLDPGEAVDPDTLGKLNERDAERRDLEAKQRWLALRAQWERDIRELEALGDLTPEQRKQLDRLRYQLKGADRRFVEEAA